jgi:hypothetical protein
MSTRTKKLKKADVAITQRDRNLFNLLIQHETATEDQLFRKFWVNSVTKQTCRDRLNKLRAAGYLEVYFDYQPNPQRKPSRRYQVKGTVQQVIDSEHSSRLHRGLITEEEIIQAIDGVEARLVLEKQGHKVVEWINERELKSKQRRGIVIGEIGKGESEISDGLAVIEDQATGKISYLEVELDSGNYYGKMLREKMAKFEGRNVAWIVTNSNPKTLSRVNQVAAKYKNIQVIAI